MYPLHYLSLFPAFPRTHTVFVAMAFDRQLDARWEHVIKPAVARIEIGGRRLAAHRVDLSRSGDAILTEILQGISESRLVLADMTSLTELNSKAVRNGNVMYEIGIAHATRLPEEVILLRSDRHKLEFDVAGVRVHDYDPDADPAAAQEKVARLLWDALGAVESRRQLAVRVALQRLTAPAERLLFQCAISGTLEHPKLTNLITAPSVTRADAAITLLLELGAIEADVIELTEALLDALKAKPDHEPEMLHYRVAPFGRALIEAIGERMGMRKPELQRKYEALFLDPQHAGAANPPGPAHDVKPSAGAQ